MKIKIKGTPEEIKKVLLATADGKKHFDKDDLFLKQLKRIIEPKTGNGQNRA